jgi:hypothetical protein
MAVETLHEPLSHHPGRAEDSHPERRHDGAHLVEFRMVY